MYTKLFENVSLLSERSRISNKASLILTVFTLITLSVNCQSKEKEVVKILDVTHYSHVFGETRNYRIFLPNSYDENNPNKRYPVIYFLHGWDQRYFGNGQSNYASYDKGDDNNGDNIAKFVSEHDVIVVKSDGYNKSRGEKYDRRPYNIGDVSQISSHRQFPIYYPELIEHIDANYNTIADRKHRAISGLSMGGFTSFWIGGKYPHMFCAVGSFCGSTEFMVGPQTIPVEYLHIDMFNNYGGMKVRLNYGDEDFIRGYHEDVNRVWTQVMDNYEFKIYKGEHATCGLNEMFTFLMNTFQNAPEQPSKWDHVDVYPSFSVWDYKVQTDRDVPGFTVLEDVSRQGFRSSVREILPDGQLLSFVNITLTTPAIYKENSIYIVNDINLTTSAINQRELLSDNKGRLKIKTDGSLHEFGINESDDKSNLVVSSYDIVDAGWATQGKETKLSIKLLNKGLTKAKKVSVKISPTKDGIDIINKKVSFKDVEVNEIQDTQVPFLFKVNRDNVEVVQFELTIVDGEHNINKQKIEIPVKNDGPEFSDFIITDGKYITVANAGIDSVTLFLGKGNGDGIANPGEQFVILVKDDGMWRRTNLSFSDEYLNPFGIKERGADSWMSYDHVGASFKYSSPLISSECPAGHKIDFLAEYWLPNYPLHIIKKGKISIEIIGKDDRIPPIIRWEQVSGDNIIYANIWDGSEIQTAKATFTLKNDTTKFFDVDMNDKGIDGDSIMGDNVFSKQIPAQQFGRYKLSIEAVDKYGNIQNYESPNTYVLY